MEAFCGTFQDVNPKNNKTEDNVFCFRIDTF